MSVISSGIVNISSGVTSTEVEVIQEGELHVLNGGWAEIISAADGGSVVVSKGGILYLCTLTGGTATVLNGGWAEAVSVEEDGLYLLSSGASTHDTIISNGGSARIGRDVLATGMTVLNGGVLHVDPVGYARAPVVSSCGAVHVSATGIVDKARICGSVFVSSRGRFNSSTVSSGGTVNVFSGGTAIEIKENGGYVEVEEGAVVTFAPNTINDLILEKASATLHSGTTANSTIVNDGGKLYISSGGIANSTTVNLGYLYVSSDGTVNDTAVYDGGCLNILSGGTASGTTVKAGALRVSRGGRITGRLSIQSRSDVRFEPDSILDFDLTQTSAGDIVLLNDLSRITGYPSFTVTVASDQAFGIYSLADGAEKFPGTITVLNRDREELGTLILGESVEIAGVPYVLSLICGDLVLAIGGKSPQPSIVSGAVLSDETGIVHSDEVYYDATISGGGSLIVSSGGTANLFTVSGGRVEVSSGGIAKRGGIQSDGVFVVSGHALAKETTVSFGGNLFLSGGTANDTAVSNGFASVLDGGAANNTLLYRGVMHVSSGGTANDTAVSNGSMFVSDGGTVSNTSVYRGVMHVSSGGMADTVVVNYGVVHVSGGGAANSTLVHSGGSFCIEGAANNNTVNSGGSMFVLGGGAAESTTVNSGGSFAVSSGGTAESTTVNSGGILSVSSGGTAGDIVLNNGGNASFRGATVDSITVNVGAVLTLSSGTMTNIIENGGCVGDYSHTSASCSYLPNTFGGFVLETVATVHSGTTAAKITINAGYLMVFSGGVVNSTTVNNINGGFYHGIDLIGGSLNYTTVNSRGIVNMQSSGRANNTTINCGGSMDLQSSCIANNTTVNSGGRMNVSSGGMATGKMAFESGAVVSMHERAVLDFNLTQVKAGAAALVNDLSIIRGTPNYTLTVSEDWTPGCYVYKLAEGAAAFDGTISVVNTEGDALGTLAPGESVRIGCNDYTLNLNDSTLSVTVEAPDLTPENLVGAKDRVSWDPNGAEQYVVEYSTDDFEHAIRATASTGAIDMLELPAGTYQWRVKADANSGWAVGEDIVSDNGSGTAKALRSNGDGNGDIFFATPNGTWGEEGYFSLALHFGSVNDWTGTREIVDADGKSRIHDLFFGSSDPNILCLTDGENGDAIFVDDVYTDLPDDVPEHTARLYMIREIRAGAGGDIVDLTSQRFEYVGDGLTIRGGDGDDVIWAAKGNNRLFGDAGNDRLVGASRDDVIAGGIGNDSMHGGGGDDVFTFCDNWGMDSVEQLATGTVTLWFAGGDEMNWDAEKLTYTDGENSVTVTGVGADRITLKFGDDGSARYDMLASAGAFAEFTSMKIFEESGKGILA